ncbi:BfmA/BtgA family mobilization protein [Spirosoma endophyticum]|uniref:Uncharacterized protein n=1 Tax=Spirosoma endophyticum TaxID=662367 RepID=A0A1I2I556_9BACT|nr:BfmA/BtgA family mobilization protein [Spirosoma endophyticum]SFF36788.1 hypothetical protein SAMN05216167_1561 [Spirosoma endophyticum]
MNTKRTDRKSVALHVGTHQQLDRMAQKMGLPMTDVITSMLHFFAVTGLDPSQPKADDPATALKKLTDKVESLDKRFIGFIREQEKEILRPMRADVQAMRQEAILTPDQLEEQLTGVVEAVQTLLRVSFRTALVDNALRSDYKKQADQLIAEQNGNPL